jgi:Acyl-CoA reductase (LuxC)
MTSDTVSDNRTLMDHAQRFSTSPAQYFAGSWHAMHHVDPGRLADLQLAALQLRFAEQRDRIATLHTSVAELGLEEITDLNAVVPALFQHAVYKSYPRSLIDRNQHLHLTRWLGRLTPLDITGVDATQCNGLDDWLDVLDGSTELRVAHSSGTAGKMSFLPRSIDDWERMYESTRCGMFQFSDPLAERDHTGEYFNLIWPLFRHGRSTITRLPDMAMSQLIGDEQHLHVLREGRMSSDAMYLAGQLRAAQARGETLEIPAALRGRRQEFEREQRELAEGLPRFIDHAIERLRGERIWILGTWNILYEMARAGLDRGLEKVFAPDSLITTGGGAKGQIVPDGWEELVKRFFGVERLQHVYSMTEMTALNKLCEHEQYHFEPWDHPVRARPRGRIAAAARRDPDRSHGVLRSAADLALGRVHHRRRGHRRLDTMPMWPDDAAHRAPDRALQRQTGRRQDHLRGFRRRAPRRPCLPHRAALMSSLGVAPITAPAIVRGELVDPDPERLMETLPLHDPSRLHELQALPFAEIVDYLAELGTALELERNRHLQEALAQSEQFADMTPPLMRASFEQLPRLFEADAVRELADLTIGIPYLEGWVTRTLADGRRAAVRAFGARTVHVIAGNSPMIAALTVIRNAVCRSDAIIKTPSNDPLTALAIVRTMAEIAPDHPLTRHVSVAYWKGGDTAFEQRLYQPAHVEKIIAWGGFASVTHVLRYVQPGLELISLDPKRSATIIGAEAYESTAAFRDVALRTATDVGALNQLACVNARIVYVAAGLEDANRLGAAIYEQLQRLPEHVSTKAKWFDPELKADIDALRASPDWYRVYGGHHGDGAVIVSQLNEPVEFHRRLSGRVTNLVPITDPREALAHVDAYTQTVGVYPESLKRTMRDLLPLNGAQRLVSLGHATNANFALPQDAIEPVRRMVKWIVDESCT